MPKSVSDLVGKTFNRLSVVSYCGKNKHEQHTWFCLCSCGNTVVLTTTRLTSKNNNTKSCGCLHQEALKNQQEKSRKHGYTFSHKNLYSIYYGMLYRCYNCNSKDWKYYGGKGVEVLGWGSAQEFVEWGIGSGYLLGLTIDRLDSSGHYSKENCEWVTRAENTRRKNR